MYKIHLLIRPSCSAFLKIVHHFWWIERSGIVHISIAAHHANILNNKPSFIIALFPPTFINCLHVIFLFQLCLKQSSSPVCTVLCLFSPYCFALLHLSFFKFPFIPATFPCWIYSHAVVLPVLHYCIVAKTLVST